MSTATLFEHFPVKEALVLDEESDLPAGDPACTALAHFALEAPRAARGHDDPRQAVTRAFDLLDTGWRTLASGG